MTEFAIFGAAMAVFSLIPILGGLFVANMGRKAKNRSNTIQATETSEVSGLRPGKVEVKGTARPTEGGPTLTSPISRDEALATKVKVERYDSGTSETGGGWTTIYEDKKAVPFVVDDGTGEVRVDTPLTSEQKMLFEMTRERVPGGQEPPERIRNFVERKQEIDETSKSGIGPISLGERRRYMEGSIEPGEDVYVLGEAREQAGWDERGYVIDGTTESGEFVVSDKPEEQLVKEGNWGGLLLYVVGGISVLFGGLMMLISLVFFA